MTSTKTFNGGKSGDETLAHFLPAGKLTAYNLNAAGVASATCVKSGAGYKVTVKLVKENVSGLGKSPVYHAQIFDTLNLTEKSFGPFTPIRVDMTYDQGTLSFTTDAQGRIVSISVNEPAIVDCDLKKGITIKANFTGFWKQDYTLTY